MESNTYRPSSVNFNLLFKKLLVLVAEDPFRIERESDLGKEQEEYFRRIHQGFVDPGSSE
jgi:hypothetical protein